jgi:hypothetical protein
MQSFQLSSHINQQGLLQIQMPINLANQDVEIILVVQQKTSPTVLNKRPIGQYRGKMKMADDFCAPLPDEFWLGEME